MTDHILPHVHSWNPLLDVTGSGGAPGQEHIHVVWHESRHLGYTEWKGMDEDRHRHALDAVVTATGVSEMRR